MRNVPRLELNRSLLRDQQGIAEMVDGLGAAGMDICLRSAAALAQMCRGIITGEGPTACGRVHFSRTIDRQDAALCLRLLVVAGRYGDAVSRVEADALLDIHTIASDRQDYLIHSYDYPPLARRALAAANKYAAIAPAAQHAQHMPAHTYSMLGLWAQSVESNTKSREAAQEQAARLWPGSTHPGVPHHLDFTEYALLQMGQEQRAKQIRDDANSIKKLGFEYLPSYTGLAAVPARFALERQMWKEAAAFEPRGSQFPQAEAITYFARAMGSARSGDLAAANQEVGKLKELRAALEKASQSYWAEQVEIQMLAASAWIAQAKGQKDEAVKFMRAAADLEDNSEKHIAMENRLYPMRELLGDLLLEEQQPVQALSEYEISFQSTPNRLRGLYGAAKAAREAGQPEKAATYFRKLAELTKDSDSNRAEIREAKAFLMHL